MEINPYAIFDVWLAKAKQKNIIEPLGAALATTSLEGKPTVRIVLLKQVNVQGVVFYSNYSSQKGLQINENPWAAVTIWWKEIKRQVRIEGRVVKLSVEESDAYFAARPRKSQLGAWASKQSEVIANREVLLQKMLELENFYQGKVIPRPPYWGGYKIIPQSFEFWQGKPHRLNLRQKFSCQESNNWTEEILSP